MQQEGRDSQLITKSHKCVQDRQKMQIQPGRSKKWCLLEVIKSKMEGKEVRLEQQVTQSFGKSPAAQITEVSSGAILHASDLILVTKA